MLRMGWRVPLAALLSAGLPLYFRYALGSRLSLILILGLTLLKTTSGLLKLMSSGKHLTANGPLKQQCSAKHNTSFRLLKPGRLAKHNTSFRLLSAGISLLLALVVLVGILITPFSAYSIWLQGVKDHQQRGVISDLFVLLAGLFSSSLSLLVLQGSLLPAFAGAGAVLAGLLLIVHPSPLALVLFVTGLGILLGVASLSFAAPGKGLKTLSTKLVLLLLVLLAALPLALLIEPGGSRLVDERLHPGLRKALLRFFPRFPLLYGIPGFGVSFNQKRLGGTPVLSGSPILEVQGNPGQTLYLRTKVFDYYTGRSWSQMEFLPEQQVDPSSGPATPENKAGLRKGRPEARITLLLDYYSLLPHTLDTTGFLFDRDLPEPPAGNFDRGFVLKVPLRYGDGYRLQTGRPIQDEPSREAGPELPLSGRSPYLQLPRHLSPELRRLAEALKAGPDDPLPTLANLERFLASRYAYNLKVQNPQPEGDFVEQFLFDQGEGYCVHFATAFIILARLNGIPARYATGFLVYLPADSGVAQVSGLSAHAWPEVWLEDRGWIPWEATSALNPSYYQEWGQYWLYGYQFDPNRFTTRQLRAILGRSPLPRPEEASAEGASGEAATGEGSILRKWVLLLLPPGLLGGLILLFRRRPWHGTPRCRERERAIKILRRLVKEKARQKIPHPGKIGWVDWVERVRIGLPPQGRKTAGRSERLRTIILAVLYGNAPLRRREVEYLKGFHRRYGRRVRRVDALKAAGNPVGY